MSWAVGIKLDKSKEMYAWSTSKKMIVPRIKRSSIVHIAVFAVIAAIDATAIGLTQSIRHDRVSLDVPRRIGIFAAGLRHRPGRLGSINSALGRSRHRPVRLKRTASRSNQLPC